MSSPKHDCDLILMEVLESNSIVWFIASLVCKNLIRSNVLEHLNLRQFNDHFSMRILIDGFNGIGTVTMCLISEKPGSRFILELLIILLCPF